MDVLLVEPDRVLAGSYRQKLRAAGHRVVHVSTAQAAVQAADKKCPECIVLNVDLPRHNGIEFLYEFRSYPEWQDVPVVLLVARINQELAESEILREQLGVRQVLTVSHTSLAALCAAVDAAGQPVA